MEKDTVFWVSRELEKISRCQLETSLPYSEENEMDGDQCQM
jgi:hypothetical protein